MVNSQPIIVRMGSLDRQLSPESDGKDYQKLVTSASQSKMDLPGMRSLSKEINVLDNKLDQLWQRVM